MYKSLLLICLMTSYGSAQVLQDPTRPNGTGGPQRQPGPTADGFPAIKVSAVFIHADNRYAVLNGQMIAEGQSWQGVKVLEVHQHGVKLANQQQQKDVRLTRHKIKQDVSDDF